MNHQRLAIRDLCQGSVTKISKGLVKIIFEHEFEPERFLGSDIDVKGRDFELISYDAGGRICPGMPLANRMLHLMLGSLIHFFDWKLVNDAKPDAMDLDGMFNISLQKAKPRAIPIKFDRSYCLLSGGSM
ncbi:hypothetical protein Droror1_Dr00019495 [Drosera rotundifolia]